MKERQVFKVHWELDNPDDFDQWWLYVLKCGPYFKVGISVDIKWRVKTLQSGNPFKISVTLRRRVPKVFVGRLEKLIHRGLVDFHHRGEWFSADIMQIRAVLKEAQSSVNQWRREYRERAERLEPYDEENL